MRGTKTLEFDRLATSAREVFKQKTFVRTRMVAELLRATVLSVGNNPAEEISQRVV